MPISCSPPSARAVLTREEEERANCRDADPEEFYVFTAAGADAVIKKWCRPCPVAEQCLRGALATGDSWAILGATTPRQRRKIHKDAERRRQQRRAA